MALTPGLGREGQHPLHGTCMHHCHYSVWKHRDAGCGFPVLRLHTGCGTLSLKSRAAGLTERFPAGRLTG